jgi:hypothetical protein
LCSLGSVMVRESGRVIQRSDRRGCRDPRPHNALHEVRPPGGATLAGEGRIG